MVKLIIGAVVCVFIVIAGFMLLDPALKSNSTTDSTTEVGEVFSYTVEGEVSKPGTYTLADNATMSDLIDAAGGIASNADDRAYFLTAQLTAGQTYFIASKFDTTDVCGNTTIEKVNINSDSADQLSSINGITASVASSIVSYRQEKGTFQTLEQLKDVYGIGDATYRRVRNLVILHAEE